MKVEGNVFGFIAVFLVPVTVVYGYLSGDWTGTTCLVLSIGLTAMIAYYLLFTARRMEARPEDRPDAEISEGSGEVGFFPPHSWWPIALAASFSVTMTGLIFGPFLVLMGAGALVISLLGLLFEYYVGINRSQGQTLGALQAMGERPTSVHKFLGD
jgi:MFS-type transporter involved in bile tolerance (Atg22 family)